MNRIAEIEKILIEIEDEIKNLDKRNYPKGWETLFKAKETNALKAQAYDKIQKLLE